jgi:uncharacterized alkaline shock family protein YloU
VQAEVARSMNKIVGLTVASVDVFVDDVEFNA